MFVCHQIDACENSIGSVHVGGYCGLNESGLYVFGNCVKSALLSLKMFVGFVAVYSQVVCRLW